MGKPSPYESLPLLKSHTAEAYVVRPTVALVHDDSLSGKDQFYGKNSDPAGLHAALQNL